MSNKKNKQESLDLDLKAIADFEKNKRKQKTTTHTDDVVDFDKWWAERSNNIKQPSHVKEILKADARGRGLGPKETMERWDWAAKMFGLLLKQD